MINSCENFMFGRILYIGVFELLAILPLHPQFHRPHVLKHESARFEDLSPRPLIGTDEVFCDNDLSTAPDYSN